MKHVEVYREPGQFAGWPANFGIWSWGDEIVVGYIVGKLDTETTFFHARDKSYPFVPYQSRSLDGGETWTSVPIPATTPGNRGFSADDLVDDHLKVAPIIDDSNRPQPFTGNVNLMNPDFAWLCARTGLGAGSVSWYYTSLDRCRSWQGPYALPDFGMSGLANRTDYQVIDSLTALMFVTGAKPNGKEGTVFCAETVDGGRTFAFKSWISPGRDTGFSIMPASVRLANGTLLVATREREVTPDKTALDWIDLFRSEDNGASWTHISRPVPATGRSGNPPAMIELRDGRLCMAYGHRTEPNRICARLSEDQGLTWSEEIVLRVDGGNHDIGYPRIVQRSDGQVVVVYYFNDEPSGERYIAATIWQP